MASKKKLLTSAIALGTAAALTLGGTFAWQSISQKALNEASDQINPGGRLHNDMAYVDPKTTDANIYVENFDQDEIYARVRLSEYMEIVMNYGTPAEVVEVVAGSKTPKGDSEYTAEDATRQDQFDYEYEVHDFAKDQEGAEEPNPTGEFFTWKRPDKDTAEADLPYFMPTFNKNKDSLLADLHGTYTHAVGGISDRGGDQYADDEAYTADSTATGYEIWDGDSDSTDELGQNRDDLNDLIENGDQAANYDTYKDHIKLVEVSGDQAHKAKQVNASNGLIALSDWLELNNGTYSAATHGNYWVYDDSVDGEGDPTGDGWVYWSSPIKGGETTGLLLDSFTLKSVMDDTWYYAIDVEGQFITANDIGKGDKTGFYANGETVTENAEKLLKNIGVEFGEETGPTTHHVSLANRSVLKISKDDTVMFTDKNGDPLEKPQMVITQGTKGTSNGNIYLTEDVDYTLKDGEFKVLDGGAISEGNAVAVAKDGIFAVVIVTPMDEDELTMTRRSEGVEGVVKPFRVAHTKVGESLPVKLTDGTSPTRIGNFATAVGLDGSMIQNVDYTYENGEITFNVSGFFFFYATAEDGETLFGLMYVDAAGGDSSAGGGQTETTTHTVTAENAYGEGKVVNLAANMMTEIDCFEVNVRIDDQPVTTNDGLTLKAYTTSEGGEPVCQVSGDKLEVYDDGDGYVCADVLEEKLPVNDNGDTTYYVEVSYTDGGQTFTSNRTACSFRQDIIKLAQEPNSYTIKSSSNLASAFFTLDGGTLSINDEIAVTENGNVLTREKDGSVSQGTGYEYKTSDSYYSVKMSSWDKSPELIRLAIWNGLIGDFVFSCTKDGVIYSANVTVVKA